MCGWMKVAWREPNLLVYAGFLSSEVWENMQMMGEGDSFYNPWVTDDMKWMWVAPLLFFCYPFKLFFVSSWRNASSWGANHIQLGSCKLAEAMLLAMATRLSASSTEKKLVVLSEDRWVWIHSEHWLSLIGLKDWKPERMNGFCWSIQGWTQRERQWVPCVCTCACQLWSPYGLDWSSRKWKGDRNTPP